MLLISKPITSDGLKAYHRQEFANPERAYYTEGNELQGYWHGQLAADIGLHGPVLDEQFDRLADGKDPFSGEQLVRYRSGKAVEEGREKAHRAGYDFTFSPAKSISISALVGGDKRIIEWHRAAVKEAADFGERYVQARMGGNKDPMTTGKWIAAGFEHDTARPVDGYPAPLLHTHLIVFNLTAQDGNSKARAIQPKEPYNVQCAMTRVYQNRIAYELIRGGYELEPGKNNAPEIKGYSREYLDSESPRSKKIQKEMERLGMTSRRAAEIIAHQDREGKLGLKPDELRKLHRAHGETFGQPADGIVQQAMQRSRDLTIEEQSPKRSVDFAIRRLSERHAVIERDGYKQHGGIVQNALTYSQGKVTLAAIEREIEARKVLTAADRKKGLTEPELTRVHHHRIGSPGERYATRDMLRIEREMIELVISKQGQYKPIAETITRDEFRAAHAHHMTGVQMHMVFDAIHGKDQIFAIQGGAGTGKTHAMRQFSMIARDHDYQVKGITPTSSARKELERSGIESSTLAKHNLSIQRETKTGKPAKDRILYLLDESSLAGAKAMHTFLTNLRPEDRVVLIGDRRQHNSIDAGRIFSQLQNAGIQTLHLERIMRQKENPHLLEVIRHFQRGQVPEGIAKLDDMGVIQEQSHREKRFGQIARDFANSPGDSIAISPDNASRNEINQAIRNELKKNDLIGQKDFTVLNLASRNDLYQEDTLLAANYNPGNWIRAGKADKTLGVTHGEYLQVVQRSGDNTLQVNRTDGTTIRYNPEVNDLRASVYRVETRNYSVGEKLQLTAQWKEKGLANRERGTIESLDENGNAAVRMEPKGTDTGRLLRFNLKDFSHLDYGYSMTSYSSQSMTIRNVLANIDTGDRRSRDLLDKVYAYVAFSRASHNVKLYTDDKSQLVQTLDRLEIRPTALSREQTLSYKRERERTAEETVA